MKHSLIKCLRTPNSLFCSRRLSTAKALDIVPTNGEKCHTPPHRVGRGAEGLYSAVKFAKMIIETSMPSQNLSGRSKVSPYSSVSNP